ncbi:MAG: hypothetical protein QMC67_00155 [Candidatus Wallbacteria bacterium]
MVEVKLKKSNKAFSSVIWLMAIVFAFAVAAGGAAPLYSASIKQNREAELLYVLKSYKKAILKYKSVYGTGPAKLADLIKRQPNPRFLRTLYDDPFYRGESLNKCSGLGILPVLADGGYIANVKSASPEKGLNGIAYSKWYVNDLLELDYETGPVGLNK